jgi:hypothetical protein
VALGGERPGVSGARGWHSLTELETWDAICKLHGWPQTFVVAFRFDSETPRGLASLLRSRWGLRVPAASHFLGCFLQRRESHHSRSAHRSIVASFHSGPMRSTRSDSGSFPSWNICVPRW